MFTFTAVTNPFLSYDLRICTNKEFSFADLSICWAVKLDTKCALAYAVYATEPGTRCRRHRVTKTAPNKEHGSDEVNRFQEYRCNHFDRKRHASQSTDFSVYN